MIREILIYHFATYKCLSIVEHVDNDTFTGVATVQEFLFGSPQKTYVLYRPTKFSNWYNEDGTYCDRKISEAISEYEHLQVRKILQEERKKLIDLIKTTVNKDEV